MTVRHQARSWCSGGRLARDGRTAGGVRRAARAGEANRRPESGAGGEPLEPPSSPGRSEGSVSEAFSERWRVLAHGAGARQGGGGSDSGAATVRGVGRSVCPGHQGRSGRRAPGGQRPKRLGVGIYQLGGKSRVRVQSSYIGALSRFGRCMAGVGACELRFLRVEEGATEGNPVAVPLRGSPSGAAGSSAAPVAGSAQLSPGSPSAPSVSLVWSGRSVAWVAHGGCAWLLTCPFHPATYADRALGDRASPAPR